MGYIVDLSVEIRTRVATLQSPTDLTYHDFALIILKSIASSASKIGANRIDIVADQYYPNSIKGPTRDDRGI